jgi:hypothetical protein
MYDADSQTDARAGYRDADVDIGSSLSREHLMVALAAKFCLSLS